MSKECVIIQEKPRYRSATPLILVHDGGGTIFNYFLVGDLSRPVYGIANPQFDDGLPWSGGIMEMAILYAQYIRTTIRKGNILLGGWSLGGMLSLQIARLLTSGDVIVKGLVMIDTPYPKNVPQKNASTSVSQASYSSTTKPEIKAKIDRSMNAAREALKSWELPGWQNCAPPPAVLLRAEDSVVTDGKDVDHVDLARKDIDLGWSSYGYDLVKSTADIPGSHFEIFRAGYLDALTEKIARACMTLDD